MSIRVSPRLESIPRYVPGMSTAQALARHGITDAVKLSSNESPFGPLPGVADAIDACVSTLNRYPDGPGTALRARLAALHGVAPEQVVLGNGSGEIILMAGQALLDPGTTVVYPAPSFALYPHLAHAAGATGIPVPLDDTGANDLDTMACEIDERTRLVVLCSPNNPTGGYVAADRLERFLDEIPDDIAVLVDEAYNDFVTLPDRGRMLSAARRRPNVLVTRTFSKAFGLSALRVGYGVGGTGWVDAIERVRPPFNVSAPAQAGALAALDALGELGGRVRLIQSERTRIEETLGGWGVPFTPSQANFILVGPFDGSVDGGMTYDALLAHGVIVRDGAPLGVPGCVRVSVGSPEENDRMLAAMAALWGARDHQDNTQAAV